jgi:hypothetical protein
MGRRKKQSSDSVVNGNPFKGFAGAVSAIEAHYREASQGVEESALPPELKESLQAALTDLLNKQVRELCAGRLVTAQEEDPSASELVSSSDPE